MVRNTKTVFGLSFFGFLIINCFKFNTSRISIPFTTEIETSANRTLEIQFDKFKTHLHIQGIP